MGESRYQLSLFIVEETDGSLRIADWLTADPLIFFMGISNANVQLVPWNSMHVRHSSNRC